MLLDLLVDLCFHSRNRRVQRIVHIFDSPEPVFHPHVLMFPPMRLILTNVLPVPAKIRRERPNSAWLI